MQLVDMLPGVMTRCNGLPEAEAIAQMRNACMEFCERTCWLTMPVQFTVPSIARSTLVSSEHRVLDIIEAKVGDVDALITYVNDRAIDDQRPGEYALTFADPGYPLIQPTPPAGTLVKLLIVAAPGPSAEAVNDVLWLQHSEALTHGALARVLSDSSAAWGNPNEAARSAGLFEMAITRAASAASRNRRTTGRRLRVRAI